MSLYAVHAPRQRTLAPERATFVRQGFSCGAFLFGPFWLVARRAWLGVALWVVLIVLLIAARRLGLSTGALQWIALLAAWLTGLEAANLWGRSLARRGLPLDALVFGRDAVEAERAYWTEAETAGEERAAPRGDAPPPAPRRVADVGLFPGSGL